MLSGQLNKLPVHNFYSRRLKFDVLCLRNLDHRTSNLEHTCYGLSIIMANPCPPPIHSVARPSFLSCLFIS